MLKKLTLILGLARGQEGGAPEDLLTQCNTNLEQIQGQAMQLQEQCNGAVGERDQQIAALQGQLGEATKASGEASSKATDLEAKVAELEAAVTKAEASASKASAAGSSETVGLKKKLSYLETELESAKSAAKELKKLEGELQKLKASKKSELEAAKSKTKTLQDRVAELEEAVKDASTAGGQSLLDVYWSMGNKLMAVVHREIVAPHYEPTMELALAQYAVLKTQGLFALAEAQSAGYAAFLEGSNLANDIYKQHVSSVLVLAQIEAKKHYNAHLAEPLAPVVDALQGLELEKHALEAYTLLKKTSADAYEQLGPVVADTTQSVKALVTEVVNAGDYVAPFTTAIEETKQTVLKPVTISLLGEDFTFENGVMDLTAFALIAFFVGYYFIYKCLLKVIVWKIGIKFLALRVTYGWLLRKILVRCVIGLTWRVLSFALSLLIFLIKLAFCCGCCGACFRRSKVKGQSNLVAGGANRAGAKLGMKVSPQVGKTTSKSTKKGK